jgi:hypothetical protein
VAKRITKGNLWGFIQSRPYASVADIRRLFAIEVEGAVPVSTTEGTCFIGLSQDGADLIRQLWHEGRIVLDLNPNVKARVVQGVYPARATFGRQPAGQGVAPAGRARAGVAGGTATAGETADAASSKKRRRRRRRRSPDDGPDDAEPAGDDAAD